jgi:hypothetical protein
MRMLVVLGTAGRKIRGPIVPSSTPVLIVILKLTEEPAFPEVCVEVCIKRGNGARVPFQPKLNLDQIVKSV